MSSFHFVTVLYLSWPGWKKISVISGKSYLKNISKFRCRKSLSWFNSKLANRFSWKQNFSLKSFISKNFSKSHYGYIYNIKYIIKTSMDTLQQEILHTQSMLRLKFISFSESSFYCFFYTKIIIGHSLWLFVNLC